MAGYVPWYRKKIERLARVQRELVDLLREGADLEQVVRAAEEVRRAKVRVLKAERARIPPAAGPRATRLVRIDDEIRHWLTLSVQTIIAEWSGNRGGGDDRRPRNR
jgi:hypothetical protein